jgi:phage baseplate assembly protein W
MAVDVYLRLPSDPNYVSNFVEVEDEVSNFVQRIEMILTTNPGEVLGSPEFGVNLECYLWNHSKKC